MIYGDGLSYLKLTYYLVGGRGGDLYMIFQLHNHNCPRTDAGLPLASGPDLTTPPADADPCERKLSWGAHIDERGSR